MSSLLAGWSVVVVFVLIGAALLATVWTTRASVTDASAAVGRGEAIAVEQAVRADLAELADVPTHADLVAILAEHTGEGLRSLAMFDGRRLVDAAGDAVDSGPADEITRDLGETHGRMRLQIRTPRRGAKGRRLGRYVIEVAPTQAVELRAAATRSLWIGAVAAAIMLGVAIVMIRREARRNHEARKREHERRLASLGEMSAVLAHEIKNPLASLKGNAQLLAAMLPAGEKPRAKADRVVDEAMRLEKLTVDLLAFVRTGSIARTPIDPAALAREVAASVSPEIAVDATGAPARWPLDAARIREVLVNLFDNAVAAGPPVRCTVARVGDKLVIEVLDRGPGIPADERDTVFEAFVTGKTHGTGLGLAVVRRVVELHRGTIEIGDGPEGGARFRVEIPES